MRDLISGEAELDDEEDDESYDEETGEARPRERNGGGRVDDSSEEEDDDDDEEEAAKVFIGFLSNRPTVFADFSSCSRSAKASSSTRMKRKKMQRILKNDVDEGNGRESSKRKKMRSLMRKI